MSPLRLLLAIVLALPTLALAQESVTLRYRFAPGDSYRYRIEHELKVDQTAGGKQQQYTSESRSTWQLHVEQATGTAATLVLRVQDIRIHAKLPSGNEIMIDSSKDTQHPLAKLVGKPLARFTIAPTGEIVDWQRLQPDVQGAAINVQLFFVRLPDRSVTVGDSWIHEFSMPLPLSAGSGNTVKFRQQCTLKAVTGNLAQIAVRTELADAVDARTRSLVAQFRLSGTVSFDLSAGRIIGTDYAIRDEVTGFAGDDSRMTVTGRLRQNIQLPVARRQP